MKDEQTTREEGVKEEQQVLQQRDQVISEIAERAKEKRDSVDERSEEPIKEEPVEEQVAPKVPDKVTIKVDGKEQEVTVAELIENGKRARQKELAADERLRQAAAERERLEGLRNKMKQEVEKRELERQAELLKNANVGFDANGFAEAMLKDEQKAAQMVSDTLNKLYSENLELRQMAQRAIQAAEQSGKVLEKREIERRNYAINSFKKKYQQIASDQTLWNLADARTLELQNEHPDWPDEVIMDQAGADVLRWLGDKMPKKELSDDNVERKRSLPTQPSSASGRAAMKPEKKPKTTKDIVAEIRKSRGLPT